MWLKILLAAISFSLLLPQSADAEPSRWVFYDFIGFKYGGLEKEGFEASLNSMYINYACFGLGVTYGINGLNPRYQATPEEGEGTFTHIEEDDKPSMSAKERWNYPIRYYEATSTFGVLYPLPAFFSVSHGVRQINGRTIGRQTTLAVPFLFARRIVDDLTARNNQWEYGIYLKFPILFYLFDGKILGKKL